MLLNIYLFLSVAMQLVITYYAIGFVIRYVISFAIGTTHKEGICPLCKTIQPTVPYISFLKSKGKMVQTHRF